jgi:copper chaperone NosL
MRCVQVEGSGVTFAVKRTLLPLILALLPLAGCAEEDLSGPPEILYGQSVCTQCGMIISDARFASATIVVDDLGRPEVWLYDDIGDMLKNERDLEASRVLSRWVHDYNTSTWIRADDALYLRSEELHTPMASHVAAFSDRASADATAESLPGTIVDWQSLMTQNGASAQSPATSADD